MTSKVIQSSFAAAALLAAAPLSAQAADLPAAPIYTKAPAYVPPVSWTGFYIGGHFGYVWGHTQIESAGTGAVVALGPTDGVVGGLLAGANWQTSSLVVGGEADIGWSSASGNGFATPPATELFKYEIRSTSHVRGRVGYDVKGTLLYLAGGLAIAQAHVQEIETTTILASGGTYTGGSIGGGVEHIFTPYVSGRIEYLYDDYCHKTYPAAYSSVWTADTYRVGLTGQTVRAALVFRLPPL